ncbi:TonB receptor [Phytophthora cinnamomi]|uniref:TonB receptor n=1 Tax=Phytophthora cinnamomi TaxID=4785 RepID=UPI00355A3CF5|nr:TonB receptor [Phytophthora cinnamomi]
MAAKTQLDFILNPAGEAAAASMQRLAPLLPAAASLQSCGLAAPSWSSSGSLSSVSAWNGEQAVLAALLRSPVTPTLRRKRDAPQLPCLALPAPSSKRIRGAGVLPSIFVPAVCSPTLDSCASAATSSEGEISDADLSPKQDAAGSLGKKKTRLCKEKGCTSLAVSRRSCVRHGGGSRCTFEGCTNGAKLRNRCFQHGGSTICLASGCNSKAKRYGYCWSHGGGRICSAEGCVKVAAQGGSCWAHGGGNRCKLEGCSKRSYQKYGYYCKAHAAYNV